MEKAKICYTGFEKNRIIRALEDGKQWPPFPHEFFFLVSSWKHWIRKKGGAILRAQQKKDFGTIPYYLEIAEKVYVALK